MFSCSRCAFQAPRVLTPALESGTDGRHANGGRACAVACVDPSSGEAYLFGGCTGRSQQVCNQLFRLALR